jgi:hypothetical protein
MKRVLVIPILAGCLSQYLYKNLPQPLFEAMPPVAPFNTLSASSCGSCHSEIFAEWRASRMSQAWTDPVFQADWEDQGKLYVCRYCHSPLLEQQPVIVDRLASITPVSGHELPNPLYIKDFEQEGVSCVACHLREGAIEGPHDIASAPHPIRYNPDFASSSRCEPCHQAEAPPFSKVKRPIADTHGEWEAWKASFGRTESCADCHMPVVVRPLMPGFPERSGKKHVFLGAWDEDFLKAGIRVVVSWGQEVEVVLENLAGHRYPTADPMRALELRFSAVASDGEAYAVSSWFERIIPAPSYKELSDSTLSPGKNFVRIARIQGDRQEKVELWFHRAKNLSPAVQAVAGEPVLLWAEETE